jgi:folylpolyglutamate synthase/dihydropteroate synthase
VTTYGFPLELIIEEAGEKGIKQIDIEGFKELLLAHQALSRSDPTDRIVVFGSFLTVGGVLKHGVPRLGSAHGT